MRLPYLFTICTSIGLLVAACGQNSEPVTEASQSERCFAIRDRIFGYRYGRGRILECTRPLASPGASHHAHRDLCHTTG